MNKKEQLKQYLSVADIHERRLVAAYDVVVKMAPFTSQKCENMPNDQVAFLDMMTTRLCKLQDTIGSKLFPLILQVLGEDAASFLDKLNRLEKLGFIDKASWWMDLREVRNTITHEYPDDYEQIAKHANEFVASTEQLLSFWKLFRLKVVELLERLD